MASVKATTKQGISPSSSDSRARRVSTVSRLIKSKREQRVNSVREGHPDNFDDLQKKLTNMGVTEDNSPAAGPDRAELGRLVNGMSQETRQLECVKRIRLLVSVSNSPAIQMLVELEAVPRLVELTANSSNLPLQLEAAWALTNIAAGTTTQVKTAVDAGAVAVFVSLLRAPPSEELRTTAVEALANLAVDFRELVLASGVLEPLIEVIQATRDLELLRQSSWLLSNMCGGFPMVSLAVMRKVLPTVAHLIFAQDMGVVSNACVALSWMVVPDESNFVEPSRIQALLECGCARRLVELLLHESGKVSMTALRTVMGLASGDDLHRQYLLNVSVLPCLFTLLNHPKISFRIITCKTLASFAMGTKDQLQAMIDIELVPALLLLFKSNSSIAIEALRVIANICEAGTPVQIQSVSQGVLYAIADLCAWCSTPSQELTLAVGTIDHILNSACNQMDILGTHLMILREAKLPDRLSVIGQLGQGELADACERIQEHFRHEEKEQADLP